MSDLTTIELESSTIDNSVNIISDELKRLEKTLGTIQKRADKSDIETELDLTDANYSLRSLRSEIGIIKSSNSTIKSAL